LLHLNKPFSQSVSQSEYTSGSVLPLHRSIHK